MLCGLRCSLLLTAMLTACGESGVDRAPASASAREPVSVLLLADEPTWSYRYFGSAWRRDPAIALRTHVASQPAQRKPGDRALGRDLDSRPATIAELEGYDVVVLCELDPAHASERFPLQLATFVERGGGLVTILSGSLASSYSDKLWRRVLPVLVPHPDAAVPPPVGPTKLRVAGTRKAESALRQRLFDLRTQRSAAELLPEMPGIYFTPSVLALLPESEVLVVADVKAAYPSNAAVVARSVGKGQSLWVGLDDLWRWREPRAERYFSRFASAMAHAVAGR